MKILRNEHPFPHIIVKDIFEEDDLNLLWKELDFFTTPNKLLPAEKYGGIVDKTNSSALILDDFYKDVQSSNIFHLESKLFGYGVILELEKLDPACAYFSRCDNLTTKVRYYHDGEYYDPHTDYSFAYIIFSYFHKEPKKYSGGELFFPDHDDYQYSCDNNSCIIIPGYIKHGVRPVSLQNSDYYDGYGRYCVTTFSKYT